MSVSFVLSLLCLEQEILDDISISAFTLCSEVSLCILQFLFGHIFCLLLSSPVLVNLAFKFSKQGHENDRQHFAGKHWGRKGPGGPLDQKPPDGCTACGAWPARSWGVILAHHSALVRHTWGAASGIPG